MFKRVFCVCKAPSTHSGGTRRPEQLGLHHQRPSRHRPRPPRASLAM